MKGGRETEPRQYREATAERTAQAIIPARKAGGAASAWGPVPETDTGGRGENPKVLE